MERAIMNDTTMKKLLQDSKTIAVVGLTNNPTRPSFGVARFLQRQGYRIIPVNPKEKGNEVLGEKAYGALGEVPEDIDIVDIFRRSEHIPPVVDDALAKGTRCIWMQEGIVNQDAAQRAEAAGVAVVMDRCILKEIARLLT
jgi:predicted CoA-binding protein